MKKTRKKETKTQEIKAPEPARWLLPTPGSIVLLMILFFIFAHPERFLLDGDTGVHIRTGDLIRQTGTVPKSDPFSFSMPGQEWFAWEWFTDLLMSSIHSTFGMSGVVGFAILVLCVVFIVLYHWTVSRGANPLVAIVLTVFAARISIVHWLARPHLLSLGFLLACVIILEDYRRRRSHWIYLLPAFTVFWANMHGAFIILFPFIAIYAVGEWFEIALRREWSGASARSKIKTYLLIGALSAVASLLTPYGPALYRHIWSYLTDSAHLSMISEFRPIDFGTSTGRLIIVLLFLGVAPLIQAVRKHRWSDIGLIFLMTYLMLQSIRHIPLAAIVCLPILTEHWSSILQEATDSLINRQTVGSRPLSVVRDRLQAISAFSRRLSGGLIYAAALAFLLTLIVGPWGDRILGSNFSPNTHPIQAAEFIESRGLKGNIYAPDEYGDYLIYRLYPKTKVFIDGRSDFYNTGPVWKDYVKLLQLDPSWPQILKKYDIEWLLLQNNSPMIKAAMESEEWKGVYRDRHASILGRKKRTAQ